MLTFFHFYISITNYIFSESRHKELFKNAYVINFECYLPKLGQDQLLVILDFVNFFWIELGKNQVLGKFLSDD